MRLKQQDAKEKMWKYFTSKNTHKYVDVLSRLLSAYNRKKHSSIGKAAIEVKPSNENETWLTLYGNKPAKSHQKAPFRIGDKVRLSASTKAFRKGYLPKWTEEIFTVSRIIKRSPLVYRSRTTTANPSRGRSTRKSFKRRYHPEMTCTKSNEYFTLAKEGALTSTSWSGGVIPINSTATWPISFICVKQASSRTCSWLRMRRPRFIWPFRATALCGSIPKIR